MGDARPVYNTMASYIKGVYSYIRPESKTETATATTTSEPASPITSTASQAEEKPQQSGYLGWAVGGVASGIYAVGSSTVGAGVSGVKWVAGTTYNVGSGVVGTAGAVVAGTASTVGSGATAIVSKITTKKKEHTD